jgi:hypothetical protein
MGGLSLTRAHTRAHARMSLNGKMAFILHNLPNGMKSIPYDSAHPPYLGRMGGSETVTHRPNLLLLLQYRFGAQFLSLRSSHPP